MSNKLTYNKLPNYISQWKELPLLLSNNKITPIHYPVNHTGWLLYGKNLNKKKLKNYQYALNTSIIIMDAWTIHYYQVIHLAGTLTKHITQLAHEQGLDTAPLDKIPYLGSPGLLIMDMDSTAIQAECIDEIAKLANVNEKVSLITKRTISGELDFSISLRQRVEMLKGVNANFLYKIRENLLLMPGLTILTKKLQNLGWHISIASGGFTYFAEFLRDILNLYSIAANELEICNGYLTGQILGEIVDAHYKARELTKVACKLKIPISQTVAIGDGANDLLMIKSAGLGIAFKASPKINEQSTVTIRNADLLGVLCILSGKTKHQTY